MTDEFGFSMIDRADILAEEAFLVLNSGEIPEVALHSSLHYLTADPEGPGINLVDEDILPLKDAVIGRYRTIILRDLTPENRGLRIYRGLARARANWQRLCRFCQRERKDIETLRAEVALALSDFIVRELTDVQGGSRVSCVNCTVPELAELTAALGLLPADLPAGWEGLCAGMED
jgi:hypothetical protein